MHCYAGYDAQGRNKWKNGQKRCRQLDWPPANDFHIITLESIGLFRRIWSRVVVTTWAWTLGEAMPFFL